jgi:hypothetical protein
LGDVPAAALGDTVPLCVFLSTSPPRKMAFRVKVDASAELLLRDSLQAATNNQTAPVNAWVTASQTSAAYPLDCADSADIKGRKHTASCPQAYVGSGSVAPIVSLVITMKDGKITSFAWDNECQNCPLSCMESPRTLDRTDFAPGGGSLTRSTCSNNVADCSGNGCDLRVFVTWAGTDSGGRNAMSAGMRLSKFTGYSLGSIYQSVVGLNLG